jgi:hypothetical protein
MKVEISRQIFEKCSNIKFNENPSSGSRVVSCGRIDGERDMMKLIVAFHNFAAAPKKPEGCSLKSPSRENLMYALPF